jgi:hypothetical protein
VTTPPSGGVVVLNKLYFDNNQYLGGLVTGQIKLFTIKRAISSATPLVVLAGDDFIMFG